MKEIRKNGSTLPGKAKSGFDLDLIKSLWAGRKTIIICTSVFVLLGLLAAITLKRTYKVESVMVPQITQSRSSQTLARLAGMSAFDLNANMTQDLSPMVYPHLLNSASFCKKLMYTPLHYAKADTAVCMLHYARDYNQATAADKIMKYTIGLPGVLMGAVRGLFEKEEDSEEALFPAASPSEGTDSVETEVRPIFLTKEEQSMMKAIGTLITMEVEQKEGYLTLSVTGSEPLQTAELALRTQELLQEEITRFRTEKAQKQLNYVQARYDETKAEAEACQIALAAATDRSMNVPTSRARIERERLQSKYSVANALYTELARQLEQAKMQVKQDTPVLTIIQPVAVPSKPSNSRVKTLIVWSFFGFILGCGIVLGKNQLPKFKELLAKAEKETKTGEDPKTDTD